jgi:hypothetical protein
VLVNKCTGILMVGAPEHIGKDSHVANLAEHCVRHSNEFSITCWCMCSSKSCLPATVPCPKWKSASLATLPDHTSVLLGNFRRTVSRARISTSALPAFGASCAEVHIAENTVNTSKYWTITILVLLSVVASLSWHDNNNASRK